MNLTQLVETIDAQILQGDIIGAFEKFAADKCVTLSSPADITRSKAQKTEALNWFFSNVASVNRIERQAVKIGTDVSDSQFLFDFTDRSGNNLVYREVIRRTWKDGKIVEEQYLLGEAIENQKKTPAAKPAVKSAAGKSGEPAPSKKPAVKVAPVAKPAEAPAKADNLVLIEGIGPKIAELLNKAGITTFKQLANTKPAAIKAILDAAGPKFQIHEPASWPKQATLARDGKTAELKKLQDQLKGGK